MVELSLSLYHVTRNIVVATNWCDNNMFIKIDTMSYVRLHMERGGKDEQIVDRGLSIGPRVHCLSAEASTAHVGGLWRKWE